MALDESISDFVETVNEEDEEDEEEEIKLDIKGKVNMNVKLDIKGKGNDHKQPTLVHQRSDLNISEQINASEQIGRSPYKKFTRHLEANLDFGS